MTNMKAEMLFGEIMRQ